MQMLFALPACPRSHPCSGDISLPGKPSDGRSFQPSVAEGSGTNVGFAAVPGREDTGAVSRAAVPAGNLAQAAHEV